jgi:thymidine kinase
MSQYSGQINLFIGCMFSGKTSELIHTVRRFKSIGKKVMVINYSEDTRYGNQKIITHDLVGIEAYMIKNLQDIIEDIEYKKVFDESEIICINEGQFFDGLSDFCKKSANLYNKIVYVCGLDGDYKQEKFGEILDLIPCSENVKRLSALCKICGNKANFTKRIVSSNEQILIGGQHDYMPVCRKHFYQEEENIISQYNSYNSR